MHKNRIALLRGMKNRTIHLLGALALCAHTVHAQPTLAWASHVGGSAFAGATAVAVDAEGNTISTGFFQNGTIDMDPGAGVLELTAPNDRDIYVQKLDPDGALLWAFRLGGQGTDESQAIAVDAAGNIYLAGTFDETLDIDPGPGTTELQVPFSNEQDAFLAKFDPDGVLLNAWLLMGNNLQRIFGVSVDAQGNIHLAGRFESYIDLDPGPGTTTLNSAGSGDVFVVKWDANGTLLWGRSMGGAQLDAATGVAVGPAGEVAVSGFFQSLSMDADPGAGELLLTSTNTSADGFIWWLSAEGDLLQATALGSSGTDFVHGIALDAAGNTYVTGEVDDLTTLANGITFGASTGSRHFFVAAFDGTQTPIWGHGSAGLGSSRGYAVAVTDQGHVAAAGEFSGTISVVAQSTFTIPGVGGSEALVIVFNSEGELLLPGACTGPDNDMAMAIAAAPGGALRVVGSFEDSVDLDPTSAELPVTAIDATELYTLALDMDGTTAVPATAAPAPLLVYPRPATTELHLVHDAPLPARAQLYNAQGGLHRSLSLNAAEVTLHVGDLPAGVYTLIVLGDGYSARTPLVIAR